VIPLTSPTIDGMGLPAVLKDICQAPQGLVIVTGPTGSGKSTSLAAMISHINDTQPLHIVTIEDPIEFVYTDKMCTIRQRQLGNDVKSLAEALPPRAAAGPGRDPDGRNARSRDDRAGDARRRDGPPGLLDAAHQRREAVDRPRHLDVPGGRARQIRAQMALAVQAVVSQRLVKRADGNGRVAAMEIMINSPQIRELIQEGKTSSIEKAMAASGDYYRMQTFNQALAKLVNERTITEAEAMAVSTSPNDLKLLLKGVTSGRGRLGEADGGPPGAEDQPELLGLNC
jgi:twitching motility protein PilT